jgi:cyanoexosortase A
MSAGASGTSDVRARWLFRAAVCVAICQVALACRTALGSDDDFWVTSAIAWPAALCLVWEERHAALVTAGRASQALGGLIAAATVVLLAVLPVYRSFDRLLPLAAGAGLAFGACGLRFVSRYRRELLLLALPVLNPMPLALRNFLGPTLVHWTAHLAATVLRAARSPVALDADVLRFPQGSLDILEGCSGLKAIPRLWVVAALVVALFPTTTWQKIGLFVAAACVGFLVNLGHIALLAQTVARGDDTSFAFWHQGAGSAFLAVGSMALAGVCWWLILRRRGGSGAVAVAL